MNHSELVKNVSAETGLTQKQVSEVLVSAVGVIIKGVAGGDKVVVHGLGQFEPLPTSERNGRNLATGKAIVIAASVRPKFKASAGFKSQVKPS